MMLKGDSMRVDLAVETCPKEQGSPPMLAPEPVKQELAYPKRVARQCFCIKPCKSVYLLLMTSLLNR